MKILIISDSHANIANLKLVLGFAKKIKAAGIFHLGDWDDIKSIKEVLSARIPLYCILGNADIHLGMKDVLKDNSKEFDEKCLKFVLDYKLIGLVHNIKDFVYDKRKFNIIFCGHKHYKSERIIDGVRIVSPGALHSIKPSFAVYDTGINKVEFFDL